MLNRYKNSEHL